jgi:hypothetical protein
MILLDKPLVSDFLKQCIRSGDIEALDTGNVLSGEKINLLTDSQALQKIKDTPDINLHTTSENALAWVYDNLEFSGLPEKINLFKNKVLFRELISDLYPEFFFQEVKVEDLDRLNLSDLPDTFIIKPSVGFFSMGVHKVFNKNSWDDVKCKIRTELEEIKSVYPATVLSLDSFIIEECIKGDEYAFDAYFDDDGKAVVLGVLKHPFGGAEDVSDRVYITSKSIVKENLKVFDDFLAMLGERAQLKNFSLHVEVRIDSTAKLIPIEVNPLRFGAWCTSADLTHHAFGFNPYIYYINKYKPDWEQILASCSDDIYSIVILDNSTGYAAGDILSFDLNKVQSRLSNVLEVREIDYRQYPIFAILFTRTNPDNYAELDQILHSDLKEFIKIR